MIERVQKGQRIRASHHNEIVGALESLRNIHGTGGLQVSNNPQGTSVTRAGTLTLKGGALQCAALNEDSVTLQAYQPVVITGQMYDTANDPNLYAPPVLRVRRRDADDDADLPVAVVSDSMQTNTIGRVYTVGVCLCYLTGDDAVRASYDTVDGTALTLTSEGSIEVVWCNDDSAKPGLIRLGGGGSAGIIQIVDLESELTDRWPGWTTPTLAFAKNTQRLWLRVDDGYVCLSQVASVDMFLEEP